MGTSFTVSYLLAGRSTVGPTILWKATDGIYCVSLIYLMFASGGYLRPHQATPISQITRILVNGAAIATIEWMGLSLLGYANRFDWPLNGPINIVSIGALVMCLFRIVADSALTYASRKGLISRNLAIVGAGPHGRRLLDTLRRNKAPWTRVIGFFDDRRQHREGAPAELSVAGSIDELIEEARRTRIDEIVVAFPWGAEHRLHALFNRLKVIPANIRLAPDMIGLQFLDAGFDRVDGLPVYNIYPTPISGWSALLKRLEDVVLGTLLLVLFSPVLLACAIAIKLDSPGPVLFRQQRYGYNNKLIRVCKFRTMHHALRDANAERLASRDDPRVTRVGRVLRRTSLDELPQLFNVLAGEMSLVGPRPHALKAKAAGKLYQEVVTEYAVRHKIKPGMTGWAQVMGWRGETDTEEKILRRVECDIYYIENWSLFLDIEILLRTAGVVIGGSAY